MKQLWIVGARASGKTTALIELSQVLRSHTRVGGVVQPRLLEGAKTTGYQLLDLSTGASHPFAHFQPPSHPLGLSFAFEDKAWELARRLIAGHWERCDVLFIDEIGRLETERGEGHMPALQAILSNPKAVKLLILGVRSDREQALIQGIGEPDYLVNASSVDIEAILRWVVKA